MLNGEILSLISTISFVVASVSFVLAVFFWIYFKIPSVIGDLSGRTAKKSIARMRASGERAGGQGYKPSAANANRGKLTDPIRHTQKPAAEPEEKVTAPEKPAAGAPMPETGLLITNKADTVQAQQTDVLDGGETTGILVEEDATVPLHEEQKAPVKRTGGKKLTMLDEVMLIHTNEVI